VYALAPRAHRVISWLTVIALVYLARVHASWRVWAGLIIVMNVFTFRQQQAPDYPELPGNRWVWAVFAAVMLALTFTVSPFSLG